VKKIGGPKEVGGGCPAIDEEDVFVKKGIPGGTGEEGRVVNTPIEFCWQGGGEKRLSVKSVQPLVPRWGEKRRQVNATQKPFLKKGRHQTWPG